MRALFDKAELLANGMNDADWAWWPFLSWRPSQEVPIRLGLLLRLYVALVAAVYVILALLLVLLPSTIYYACYRTIFIRRGVTWPSVVMYHGGLFFGKFGLWVLAGDCVYCLLMGLFFALSWNRRAARLRQPASAVDRETPPNDSGTWPPAPHNRAG